MSDQPQGQRARPDLRFFIVVCSLLLLIIALLAALWLRDRRRTLRAEAEVARLRLHADAMAPGRQYLKELPKYLSVPREALKTRSVRLDGQKVVALRLPTELAEQMGFDPGEVILVDRAPTTAATTAPTTRGDDRPAK